VTRYEPPIDSLLRLGESHVAAEAWPEYEQLGVSREHVPELVGMATDDHLLNEAEEPASWAPVHAVRALGQLRAEEAVAPLIGLLDVYEPEDVGAQSLLVALGMIGPVVLPPIASFLARRDVDLYRRALAGEAVAEVARYHPDARQSSIAVLAEALRHFVVQPPELNGLLVSSLLNLDAIEVVELIRQAYEADAVAIDINGDWEDVQVELGLLAHRVSPRPTYGPSDPRSAFALLERFNRVRERAAKERTQHARHDAQKQKAAKQKRKQQAASRRRNRGR
jgi:hypothetical protein